MFNKEKRYITKGINLEVDVNLQVIIWGLIDKLNENKDTPIDYLQIFHICKKNGKILLEHKQEVPKYKKLYEINNIINDIRIKKNLKLFVIDNVEYSTMMLSHEY